MPFDVSSWRSEPLAPVTSAAPLASSALASRAPCAAAPAPPGAPRAVVVESRPPFCLSLADEAAARAAIAAAVAHAGRGVAACR